jgi:hypothetical protein
LSSNPPGLIRNWTSEQSLSPISWGRSEWVNAEADWRDMVGQVEGANLMPMWFGVN